MRKSLILVGGFVIAAAVLATGASSGEPAAQVPPPGAPGAAPAVNPPGAVPGAITAAPVQAVPGLGQVRFGGGGVGGGGGGGGGIGGAWGVPPAGVQPQLRFNPANGVLQVLGANAANPFGVGNVTFNIAPEQNTKTNEISEVMRELRASEDPGEKADLKMRLANVVTDYFDEDLKARESELNNLEDRLKKLHAQLDRRRAAKDEIIQLQLKVLANDAEGLGFSNDSDSHPPMPTTTTVPAFTAPAFPK